MYYLRHCNQLFLGDNAIMSLIEEIEEAIMALRLAGGAVPTYKILENGVVYFDYGQEEGSAGVPVQESGDNQL